MSRYHLLAAAAGKATGPTKKNLYQILSEYSMTSGLVGAWDAGSIYDGSSQLVPNHISSSTIDIYRGDSSGASASDPIFNGVAGSLSENTYFNLHFSCFTNLSGNSFWFGRDLHWSGQTHACMVLLYPTTNNLNQGIVGTHGGSGANHGFAVDISTTGEYRILFANGDNFTKIVNIGSMVAVNSWQLLYYHMNVVNTGNGFLFYNNGSTYNPVVSFPSPSSADASYRLQVGARGNLNTPLVNNSRIAAFAFWNVASPHTTSQLNNVRTRLKERFTTLP